MTSMQNSMWSLHPFHTDMKVFKQVFTQLSHIKHCDIIRICQHATGNLNFIRQVTLKQSLLYKGDDYKIHLYSCIKHQETEGSPHTHSTMAILINGHMEDESPLAQVKEGENREIWRAF